MCTLGQLNELHLYNTTSKLCQIIPAEQITTLGILLSIIARIIKTLQNPYYDMAPWHKLGSGRRTWFAKSKEEGRSLLTHWDKHKPFVPCKKEHRRNARKIQPKWSILWGSSASAGFEQWHMPMTYMSGGRRIWLNTLKAK